MVFIIRTLTKRNGLWKVIFALFPSDIAHKETDSGRLKAFNVPARGKRSAALGLIAEFWQKKKRLLQPQIHGNTL